MPEMSGPISSRSTLNCNRRSSAPVQRRPLKLRKPSNLDGFTPSSAPESSSGSGAAWVALGLTALGVGMGLAAPAQAGVHDFGPPGWSTSHAQDFGLPSAHGTGHGHGQSWDRQNRQEGAGWFIPRNEGPAPEPHFAFPVPQGTQDLGPVQVLDNTRGKLRMLRLQWPNENDPRARDAHVAMFTDLLTQTDSDVRFEIVAESGGASDLRQLLDELEIPKERYNIHSLYLRNSREEWVHEMSMWARDNGVTLTRQSDGREVLLLPRSFRNDGQLDAVVNRVIIQATGSAPAYLAQTVPDLIVRRSELNFEGGDIVANGRHVLISADTLADNAKELGQEEEAVIARFAAEFGRPVISVDPEPDFHIDMGVAFLDDHTAVVADPGMALDLLEQGTGDGIPAAELAVMRQATHDKELQTRYDQLAANLEGHQYRVLRMPNLAGKSLRSPYLTYQNALFENFTGADGRVVKRVYMPTYDMPTLDGAAREAYEAEGFEVIPVRAALLSTRLGGGLRCAVGELDVLN